MMSKVIINSDINNILDSNTGIEINDISDYLFGYKKIQEAIYKDLDLNLIVRNQYCLNAYKKMQKIYGEDKIVIKKHFYRQKIEEALDTKIPSYITNKDLKDSELLKKVKEFNYNKGASFEEIILANFLNNYFSYKKFPVHDILDFLDNTNINFIKKNKKNKLFRKAFKTKISSWKNEIKSEEEREMIESFLSNPIELFKNLAIYNLIYTYPSSLVNRLIGEEYKFLKKVNFKKDNKERDIVDLGKIKEALLFHLNSKKDEKMTLDKLKGVVHQLSGNFTYELDFILELIENSIEIVDINLINELKIRFKNIIDSNYISKINSLIPPDKPLKPSNNFDLNDWLHWASEEYLDYRFWLEENNKEDKEVDQYSFQYSNWLFNNYLDLISKEKNIMHKVITSKIGDELTSNDVSVILIIDNFNYKYVSYLKDLFNKEGFTNINDEPILSMIPSETYINKGTLLGMQPYEIDEKPNYNKMCDNIGKMYDKNIKYLSNIGKLKTEKVKNNYIYVINYLMIDKTLHENQKQAASPLNERIINELEWLVKIIGDFIDGLDYKFNTKLYVISDHGSVKISEEKINLIPNYKDKIIDDGYRSAKISDDAVKQLKNRNQNFCYIMDKNTFGTPYNYLIAKEYYRFKKTDNSFYVHGGLTPEETIVPFLTFEKRTADIKYPELDLKTNEIRKSVKSNIKLVFINKNNYPLTELKLEILNSEVKGENKTIYIDNINEFTEKNIDFRQIKVTNKGNEKINLLVKVKFNYLGERYTKEYNFSIKIKSIQENKFNLNDLL